MDNVIPYQEVKLECQTVDEIVEDIGILKKIEEASKFEIGRRLVYLKETCKHGEYLPKLEEMRINVRECQRYTEFYIRFGSLPNTYNCTYLGTGKIRELLRIPKGKEEEYLDKISDPNEVTAEQLREEIDKLKKENNKLKQEKQAEENAKNIVIESNLDLQSQLEKEKGKVEIKEVEVQVTPDDYYRNKQELKEKENELCRKEEELRRKEREIQEQQNKLKEQDERMKQYQEIQERLVGLGIDEEDGNIEYNKALALLQDLSSKVGYLIIKDIPPAKYKPCLKFEDTKKEYSKILDEIDKWTNELRGYLYKENLDDDIIKIIDVEVK